MIEVEHLTRYYGRLAAVQDVSFSIRDREIVGFLGLNGAGKSTLLRVLAGLLLPSSGTVRIDGVDATAAPDALRRRIGFLPEDPPLYREMRVAEFLRWCGEVKGRSAAEVARDLPAVMATCQIDHVAERPIGELSHGYRKRVGIAQAIVHRPALVVLDEPISGLDPAQIVEMREVVRGLKRESTVLVSSHILSEITQTCDRILVVHGGRLVAEGAEAELAGRLGSAARARVVVRGDRAALERALAAVGSARDPRISPAGEGLWQVEVAVDDGAREALAAAIVQQGLGLRGLEDGRGELEQIFLQLTGAAA